MGLSHFKDFE